MKLSCPFLLIAVTFLFNYALGNKALGNETDRFALLKLKESISGDPQLILSSWNESVHFCKWPGISCGKRHQRVYALVLGGYQLRGTISPQIGNLSFLRVLFLRNNSFHGEIPQQVTRLSRLRSLDLGDNEFEGQIPTNLSRCSRLKMLNLGRNRLGGIIPSELGSLVELEGLYLSVNSLRGGVPASLGNITSLEAFSAAYNALSGMIPLELGRWKSLTVLTIGANNLFGTIPLSLFNVSSLQTFSITRNRFNGTFPTNIGLTLPNLQRFEIAGNNFFGTIPESISNASQLKVLDMTNNNFFGQVPRSLGNLQNLTVLSLSNNSLGSYSDINSLDFISYLTNCSQMKNIDLSLNDFGGSLPNSIANLSSNLKGLFLGSNKINGKILETFDNSMSLIILSMEYNLLDGEIPSSLGRLQNLQILALEGNFLSGNIPISLKNLTQISELDLSSNNLEGIIPPEIGNCKSLQYLDFSKNRLTGVIPVEVFDIFSLSLLFSLSGNSLNGSLPIEVGKLKNIIELDLSENNLTNEIPETIGRCESLTILDLHGNFFQGSLPSALASLKVLEYLDLSRNNLTGKIPKDLEKLQYLDRLNISFNDLDGEVPKTGVFQNTSEVSLVGNSELCGGVPMLELPRCLVAQSKEGNKTKALKLTITIVSVFVVLSLILFFVILFWKRKSTRESLSSISTIGFLSKVSYKTLHQATSGFSPNMLIGVGSFGSVYKAFIGEENNPFAIKVLNLRRKGAEKSFIAECNALRNVRHRNLVKILTCCSGTDYNGNDFKALIYEYMSNGSLDKWLHDLVGTENGSDQGLSLIQRVNMAIDVASAIHYLHEDCDQPVIHCDLKPSNILLNNEMVAHVSDFGIARLISNTIGVRGGKSSSIGIKGTVGYAAPEYAMGGEPSKQGDVYSYGILLLEMFTRKRPTDEMFKDDFNLHNFVEAALPDRLAQIADSALLPHQMVESTDSRDNRGEEIEAELEENPSNADHVHKCLISVLEIGLACSRESPNERMNLGDVTRELQHIHSTFVAAAMREHR